MSEMLALRLLRRVAQTRVSALLVFLMVCATSLAQERPDTSNTPSILVAKKRSADSTEKLRRELPGYQWLFGFYGFGNYDMHTANFSYLTGMQPIWGNNPIGTATSFGGGLGGIIDWRISKMFQIQTRFSASLISALLAKPEFIGTGLDMTQTMVVPQTVQHNLQVNVINANLQPTLGIRLADQLFLDLGVNLALPLAVDYTYTDSMRTPLGYGRYKNGDFTLAAQRGSVPAFQLSITAVGGIQWYFPISRSTFLAPFVRYHYPLTDLIATRIGDVNFTNGGGFISEPLQSGSWRMASVQAGIAYQWGEGSVNPVLRETVYERDTTTTIVQSGLERVRRISTETGLVTGEQNGLVLERTVIHESYVREVPNQSAVKVAIGVAGIDLDGTRQANPTIVLEEFETETFHPLLPHIFFADDGFDLKQSRQVLLTTPKAADTWTDATISNDALVVHSNALNVVGVRLKNNPAARLTITGCNSNIGAEKDDVELSMKRAKAVQTYLTTVWRIKADRIRVQARTLPEKPSTNDVEDGTAENRRVELSASTPDILAPVINSKITRTLTPPSLELRPSIDAPAGTRSWTMTVQKSGSTLAQWTGTNEVSERELWRLTEKAIGETEIPLVAKLKATDLEDRSAQTEVPIMVKQITIKKKRSETTSDQRLERFSLMLFDFDRAELNSENLGVLALIKQRIQPNSSVTVLGYGDRVGSKEYNRELAFKRCGEVKNFLQLPENRIKIIPIGNDFLLHDNATPEGRSYCRIVQVVIATPLQK
jgi:outer membrane protein OmpA-like peptidoglycan-associated protein